MNKVLACVIWIVTVLTAYWFGLGNKPSIRLQESQIVLDANITDLVNFPPSDFEMKSAHRIPHTNVIDYPPDSVSSLTGLEMNSSRTENTSLEKLISSHPIQRLNAFADLLKNPDSKAIDSALQAYESLPGGPGRFSELKMLAFAWGQVDPVSALNWAKKQEHWDEHVASSSIMDSWARQDADAAILWAKENFKGEENPYFVGIINGLSESSLPKATDLMTELPYGRVRGRTAHMLFEKVWSKGEDVAIHWAEHLPEGSLQSFAFGELGEKVARTDMPRAIQWVDSMEESPLKIAVCENVAKEMAKANPQHSASWIVGLPEGESREAGMVQVAEVWSRKDPVATAEWINQMPVEFNKDPLIETLVNKIHKSDPQSALSWAETISNPERRKHMTDKVIKVIKKKKFATGQTE